MSRKIPALTSNYDGAAAGYPEGSFRDNPGDLTGSGVVSAWGNDCHYAIAAAIYKYLGDKNGNPETTTSSDFLNAIEAMVGGVVDGVSAWSSGTDYSTLGDVSVMRYGVQFTSILASGNLNKDPMTNPTFWMPCPTAREVWSDHVHGTPRFGSLSVHDHTNANYKQYFSLGHHVLGGYAGYAFDAYGVHLDGSAVGSGDLSDIIEAWHLKASFAPGSTGSRTLQDAKGRVIRAIDASGGRADLIGEVLADQMQGHWHDFYTSLSVNFSLLRVRGVAGGNSQNLTAGNSGTGEIENIKIIGPTSDGVNGTPRTGSVTADKSITVGVPYMVICVPSA